MSRMSRMSRMSCMIPKQNIRKARWNRRRARNETQHANLVAESACQEDQRYPTPRTVSKRCANSGPSFARTRLT